MTSRRDDHARPARELSDEDLFRRYLGGDMGCFRSLVERHHDDLLRFLTRLVGDRAGAEDVFQDAFLQVHQSAETFDTSRRFKPWLFTIAANKGRDFLRKRGRRSTLDLSAPVQGNAEGGETFVDLLAIDVPRPEQVVEDRERDAQVQRAVDMLPWSLKEILLLAYFQRLSYAQIAEDLEIPLGTVKSRLHAAVAAFARNWKSVNESQSR
ncbi:MAG: sigma-70 family RNA polymerase sigma factor [Phycisphaerae bacterium]|nr:sigma-70 family RNA polymerase sigma factor [Phycisphaerae bacterium]